VLESREALILQVLKELPKEVVLVGDYAVNAYVPPRFSIDCDIVVLEGAAEAEKALSKHGFKEKERGDVPNGEYIRFVQEGDRVSFDLLLNSVLDRDSGIVFEGSLFKRYSKERATVGRADPTRIKMRIADPELLFSMKFVSARRQDIRDVFMLSGTEIDRNLIEEIVRKKCGEKLIEERARLIKAKVTSKHYRDSLQGAFGRIPDKTFNTCSSNLLKLLDALTQKVTRQKRSTTRS
jgi:hypothetical protein